MVVMAVVMMGGYLYWQGRHRFDPLAEDFDFEKHHITRHLVDMNKRVDKEGLKAWLEEQERNEPKK